MQFDDVAFMSDSTKWPSWPMCPVKRPSGNWYEFGVLVDAQLKKEDGNPMNISTVVHIGLYDVKRNQDIIKAKKTEYESFAAIAADGWIVD